MSVVPHPSLLWLSCVLLSFAASPALAQETETPGETANVPAETAAAPAAADAPTDAPTEPPPATPPAEGVEPPQVHEPTLPPGVEGPLYTVAPEADPVEQAAEVREIYRESDQTFLNVLWWWVVLIAVLAGAGYGAFMLWGRRQPRPPSGR